MLRGWACYTSPGVMVVTATLALDGSAVAAAPWRHRLERQRVTLRGEKSYVAFGPSGHDDRCRLGAGARCADCAPCRRLAPPHCYTFRLRTQEVASPRRDGAVRGS